VGRSLDSLVPSAYEGDPIRRWARGKKRCKGYLGVGGRKKSRGAQCGDKHCHRQREEDDFNFLDKKGAKWPERKPWSRACDRVTNVVFQGGKESGR